ncbi:hypothetical protein ERO13_D03G027900v2 [Gossypium hirsutum]|uniref:Uncharacterized protein n=4 Tax=Gossypium TaxID=3633 RepID=A0A5J5S058_GOSBA|nr:hypothetical protein ES319_D03G029200v1 [Gossypium barbadense]KAG4153976.1 hypothetical protein ERO13_D03G027900v2 [Gossypium hirsutum]TYG75454.1 hypothetical protein ES288_D03G032600v1 [Gossypium darwinii]TYH79014.1 hypothetical protein ES332_D03G031900v1 [Gossypium tomentosum]TYI89093.1 hypothetical protein E1A91_D03G029900v1 [Gossypium mustelinum]
MDPRYTAEIFKHLEMQNELLLESHSSVSHQLHKLQVEEEMLMRKFHELMKAQAVNKKNENNGNISTALVDPACIEGDETGNSAPSVLVMSKEQL